MIYYKIIRPSVKYALHLYMKRIGLVGIENIPKDAPVIFAATHSNSFLDALFITTCFDYPVYAMARGDAFNKPFFNTVLTDLRMLPIYRIMDGDPEGTKKNQVVFDQTIDLLANNQKVLIFPEGISKHQSELLVLKKGIAVMVQNAWQKGIPLQVIPVGINYDEKNRFGMKTDIVFGKPIKKEDFQDYNEQFFTFWKTFSPRLTNDIKASFPTTYNFKTPKTHWGFLGKAVYYVAWLINFPLYLLCMYLANKFTKNTVFFDSAMVGFIALLGWVYYFLLFSIGFVFWLL